MAPTKKPVDTAVYEENDDFTSSFYCGSSHADASDRCHKACPSGNSNQCPEGMWCFAYTSCTSSSGSGTNNDQDGGEGGGSTTVQPTVKPTTKVPTQIPTRSPTRRPTNQPTRRPTNQPTEQQPQPTTKQPTDAPTKSPVTLPPTSQPTKQPSASSNNSDDSIPILVALDVECSSVNKCGLCHGDCDSDLQCDSGLKCFMRSYGDTSPVPGCQGGGDGDVAGTDYCYDPSSVVVSDPSTGDSPSGSGGGGGGYSSPTKMPSTTSPTVPSPCPPDYTGVKASELCTGYFYCLQGSMQGGVVPCQPGLLFDETQQVCNWANQVQCEGVTASPTTLKPTAAPSRRPTVQPTDPVLVPVAPSPTRRPTAQPTKGPDLTAPSPGIVVTTTAPTTTTNSSSSSTVTTALDAGLINATNSGNPAPSPTSPSSSAAANAWFATSGPTVMHAYSDLPPWLRPASSTGGPGGSPANGAYSRSKGAGGVFQWIAMALSLLSGVAYVLV